MNYEWRRKVLRGVGFCLFLMGLSTIYVFFDSVSPRRHVEYESIPSPVSPQEVWYAVWPIEHAQLTGLQTFVLAPPFERDDSVAVMGKWTIDGGVQTGTLKWEGGVLSAIVDTSTWDWRRDNLYTITFTVVEGQTILSDITVPVIVGARADVSMGAGEHTDEIVANVNTATVIRGVNSTSKLSTKSPTSSSGNPFSIEWKPASSNQNQYFTYHFDFDPETINAFWKTQGGHENHVYPNDRGVFEVAINMNGWRWLEKGPYPIEFSILDKKTSTPLATEIVEMYWVGLPGESEMTIKSKGAKTLITTLPSATVNGKKPTTPPSSVVREKGETYAHATLTPKQTTVTRAQKPSFDTTSLLSVSKPAVEQSLLNTQDVTSREAISFILRQPNAVWLNGDGHDTDAYIDSILALAREKKSIPTFVLYNIPYRDCNSYSSGGAKSSPDYKAWIDRIATLLNGVQAIVIVEPDALAQLNCAPEAVRTERLELLTYASQKMSMTSSKLRVYIDAGHPHWVNSTEMARRLERAGISYATGFSLNVSNYVSIEDNKTYGDYLANLVGGKGYVVDTSRNGNGQSPTREWCNPSGRALGVSPQLISGEQFLDAYLWIKFPGESDGQCNGGPSAGMWWPAYATDLYHNR